MDENEIEAVELNVLLEAIYQCYGYDFRSYARASIERRVRQFVSGKSLVHISQLIPLCLYDTSLFSELVQYLSIAVTEMFRDPFVYRSLRENVVPILRTFPRIRVWHAGCATGEEAYSLAIVLAECGLDERATIFGTDFNDNALATARAGIYPLERMREFTQNYQQSGGTGSFSEYYHASYGSARLCASLRERITFANHNLTIDQVFSETHLVFCRNVLIYFNRDLQNRVLRLFTDSLVHGGFLCLGSKEDLELSGVAHAYESMDRAARIYRKVAP